MNAVNAVKLFILVWTFTVCRADDDDISVNCADVTGSVGKEATFTCSVSLRRSECCITLYKYYTDNYNYSTIYRQEHPQDPCGEKEKSKSFTCKYSPTPAEPGPFRFFVQTTCGWKDTEFTVDITEPRTGESTGSEESLASTVIAAVAGCFIIVVIIMTIIYKMKPNYGLQKRMLLGCRHDDYNSNCPVNMI